MIMVKVVAITPSKAKSMVDRTVTVQTVEEVLADILQQRSDQCGEIVNVSLDESVVLDWSRN